MVLISGCVNRPYEQPLKVESSNNIQTSLTENPKIQTFKVGESASDGKLKITVNGFNFKDKIVSSHSTEIMGEEYESSFDYKPKEGYKFLIIDITVENIQTDQTATISELLLFDVSDKEGYSYDYSFYTSFLDKNFQGGDLLPGMKRKGNIAFEVSKDVEGLKFAFKFDIAGQTALFELK